MKNIKVKVVRTSDGQFYENGLDDFISSNAQKIGKAFIAADEITRRTVYDIQPGQVVPANHPVRKIAVVKVNDPIKGILYISDTEKSIADANNLCCNTTIAP